MSLALKVAAVWIVAQPLAVFVGRWLKHSHPG